MALTCTRHGSQFDLAHDCAVLRGPAARPPVVYAREGRGRRRVRRPAPTRRRRAGLTRADAGFAPCREHATLSSMPDIERPTSTAAGCSPRCPTAARRDHQLRRARHATGNRRRRARRGHRQPPRGGRSRIPTPARCSSRATPTSCSSSRRSRSRSPSDYSELHTKPLVELLERKRCVGVFLLRLGGFSVGLLRDGYVVDSKTDRRFVKNRHRKGGQSQRRFERIREKQIHELFGEGMR